MILYSHVKWYKFNNKKFIYMSGLLIVYLTVYCKAESRAPVKRINIQHVYVVPVKFCNGCQ